jgi:hypothetical protein
MGTSSTQTLGPAPPNVVVSTTGAGKIFFGANKSGITAYAPDNHVNALDRIVTFDTGKAKDGSIKLEGNVTITADPPAGMETIQVLAPRVNSVVRILPSVSPISAVVAPLAERNSFGDAPRLSIPTFSAPTAVDLLPRMTTKTSWALPAHDVQTQCQPTGRASEPKTHSNDEIVIDTDGDV